MEVIHLFHLDFWRAKVQDNKNRIFMTDVTTDDVTITMIESCNGDGFFKELWSGRILWRRDNNNCLTITQKNKYWILARILIIEYLLYFLCCISRRMDHLMLHTGNSANSGYSFPVFWPRLVLQRALIRSHFEDKRQFLYCNKCNWFATYHLEHTFKTN